MFPNIDWMYGLAAAIGAVATALIPRKAAPATTGQHPLFDTLVQVLEGKLSELIHVEPGPDGAPMFTIRVVLVNEAKK